VRIYVLGGSGKQDLGIMGMCPNFEILRDQGFNRTLTPSALLKKN